MKSILFLSILLSVFSFARAEDTQYVSYDCQFQRDAVPGAKWDGMEGSTQYAIVPQMNQAHVSAMGTTGFQDNMFAGYCAGIASDGDQPSLNITWAEGNHLDTHWALGCSFSGDSVKISEVKQKWSGGDEYTFARKTFVDSTNRPIEIVIVIGMKPLADMNTQRCPAIFKKIIGDGEESYQSLENSHFRFQNKK